MLLTLIAVPVAYHLIEDARARVGALLCAPAPAAAGEPAVRPEVVPGD